MDRILVINSNSAEAVTRGIDDACAPLRIPGGPQIDCVTLKEGPPGIESQQHADGVVALLGRLVGERESDSSAFVIACDSDPGMHALRDTHGANVVVMGCAGLARYRRPLQDEIGIPVVEPTQAAVTMATGRVRLGWEQS